MKNRTLFTLVILIALTLLTGLATIFGWNMFGFLAVFFMGIAGVKFYLVAFEFMELRKANRFWQITVVGICFLIITIIGSMAA